MEPSKRLAIKTRPVSARGGFLNRSLEIYSSTVLLILTHPELPEDPQLQHGEEFRRLRARHAHVRAVGRFPRHPRDPSVDAAWREQGQTPGVRPLAIPWIPRRAPARSQPRRGQLRPHAARAPPRPATVPRGFRACREWLRDELRITARRRLPARSRAPAPPKSRAIAPRDTSMARTRDTSGRDTSRAA